MKLIGEVEDPVDLFDNIGDAAFADGGRAVHRLLYAIGEGRGLLERFRDPVGRAVSSSDAVLDELVDHLLRVAQSLA